MQLTRDQVTTASRTMLPAYPIFAAGIGINFTIKGAELVQAGVFYEVANTIAPLRVWGVLFLIVAAVHVAALAMRRRWAYQVGLALMVGLLLVWAVVGLVAAIRETGSYTAALWPGFVACACIASFRSLNVGEK